MFIGQRSMLLEVPNRGNARILALVDGGDEELAHDAGMHGYCARLHRCEPRVAVGCASSGAAAILCPDRQGKRKDHHRPAAGDLMLSEVMPEIPLGHLMEGHLGGVEYPVAAMKDPRNVLTVRNSREGQRTVIPHAEWQFAHTVSGKLVPSDRFIHLNGASSQERFTNTSMLSPTRSWPAVASRPYVTLLPTPSTMPTLLLRPSGLWRRHFAEWALFARLSLPGLQCG